MTTERNLFKKYYKKRSRILNKENGFTHIYYRFKPHYFDSIDEAIKAAKEFERHFCCYSVVFPSKDKFTFVRANVNGEINAKDILDALKIKHYV